MESSSTKPAWSIFIFFLFQFFIPASVTAVGVNYGQIANNLPHPSDAVSLVRSIGATKIKLYDADPNVISAFANTGVEIMIGLGNEYLTRIQDPAQARDWIRTHISSPRITAVFVGNEVLTFNDSSLSAALLPAMTSVHDALSAAGLAGKVAVTTAHSLAILESSYPPSSGKFRSDLAPVISKICAFQTKIGSPFLINAYPYFAYKGDPKQVSLDFVLFQPNSGVLDASSGLRYDNMLFAQIDAVHSALHKLGFGRLSVHISETGWPSKGDPDEAGASLENAKKYNSNLLKIICQKRGTPMRPDCDLNIYFFALFNENLKPGPTSERNYGLFKPDGSPVYSLGVGGGNKTTSAGTASPPPSFGTFPMQADNSTDIGYLAISSAGQMDLLPKVLAIFFLLMGLLV